MEVRQIEQEYLIVSQQLPPDRDSVFPAGDLLGRTWSTLRREIQSMFVGEDFIIPSPTIRGLGWVMRAIFNLWFEETRIRSPQEFRNLVVPIPKPEADDYRRFFTRHLPLLRERMLKIDYSTRMSVNILQDVTHDLLQVTADGMTEQEATQLQLGVELGWRRWRELSTDA